MLPLILYISVRVTKAEPMFSGSINHRFLGVSSNHWFSEQKGNLRQQPTHLRHGLYLIILGYGGLVRMQIQKDYVQQYDHREGQVDL